MSDREDRQLEPQEEWLTRLKAFWRILLPETFCRLYSAFPTPFLPPCEFYSLRKIVQGAGRSFGMTPQFLPFGRAIGEGGIYGFYVTPENEEGELPVAYWDEDIASLRPVASSFGAFLRHCLLTGRYEAEEQWPDDVSDWQEEAEVGALAEVMEIPAEYVYGDVAANAADLYERLVESDPLDATSLCHLGCLLRERGDTERALDFYHRACEAAPWFGDCDYLVADIYRESEKYARAIPYYWAVGQRPIPFCTQTQNWNLGEEHPEADIYEVAADVLSQLESNAEPALRKDPLWRVLTKEDPYDPDVRERLGDALLSEGNLQGAEREYLSALSLCSSDTGRQPLRIYDSLIALYVKQGRARDAALARYDRELPRTLI